MQFCFKMIKGDPCFFYSRSKDLTWKENIKYFYILFEPNIKINQKEVKK